ncbi:hypothetical protein K493DRAFT_405080 [Basidiobolus meristosporus CBS 931.73]|uniref:Pyrrolo-quinoline quinone repeat domain-containing protein n=1 Tax=Basidiobolus meristosporus CBS 931.73 TaxID=1314790 RepID=A0A1Y1YYK9_9FUNG|nr:hypothetical protein K493DRAFT_405080 [Basidiobolus meristosporus CBS 931.73]|eukprot:ORY03111.1 hypothetical protein K493DRAFT_405080 [Basidiobolus meristosporus CBS 931.73]
MSISDLAFGYVYAFEKFTGIVVWRSYVCGSELSIALYCCPAPSDLLICGVEGKIAALRLSNGEEVWRNHVTDLGYYHPPRHLGGQETSISTAANPNPAHDNVQPTLDPGLIFVASLSDVRAIDKETSSIRWKMCLPEVQHGIPLLLLDHQNSLLFMTCKKQVFALSASSGKEVWRWKFPNCKSTFITMASPSSVPDPAKSTNFHNNPCLQSKTNKSSRKPMFY